MNGWKTIICVGLCWLFSARSVLSAQTGDELLLLADSTSDSLHIQLSTADSILSLASTYIGTPYQYGSTSSRTFDCSGFVCHCFGQFGIELPHGSAAQAAIGMEIPLDEVRKGDLMFFNGRKAGGKHIGHVSMVLSTDDGKIKMIHATHRGVIIDVYPEMEYYRKRFVKACRIFTELSPE